MTTEATTFSRHIAGPDSRCRTVTKPDYRRRFRHFIEHSDWDEEILAQEEKSVMLFPS